MIVAPIGGLILLALDIYVIIMILNSSAEAGSKLLWVLVVLFLPLVGPLLYLLMGRGASTI